eukprot:13182946-Ditylum_brightwellii.AAC.1
MLQFTDILVKNSNDPDHYLSPMECCKYMTNLSFEALKNEIPNPKLDSEEKKAVAFAKNWDKTMTLEQP